MTLRNRFNIWITGCRQRRKQRKLTATFAHVGRNVFFSGSKLISSPKKLTVGDNTWFGENFFAKCEGGLSIGSGVIISRGVEIWTANHNYDSDDLRSLPYDKRFILKPVSIKDNVWIGSRVTIVPGGNNWGGSGCRCRCRCDKGCTAPRCSWRKSGENNQISQCGAL